MNVLISSASRKVSLIRAFQSALSKVGGGLVFAADITPYAPALYAADKHFLLPSSKDDAFINLVCLKTARMLLGSELKTHSLNAIALKDGPSSLDLRGIVTGLKILFDDINKRYDEAITQYKLNGVVGQAILGPYSPGSDAVARTYLSQRTGWFE